MYANAYKNYIVYFNKRIFVDYLIIMVIIKILVFYCL